MTSYNYASNVRTPQALGMSPDGTLTALGKDITGLISYTQLLVEGTGTASATGKPMGNRYFLKTLGTCRDNETKNIVDRYIYINNIPMGNIPFISESLGGGKITSFRGLIPGMFSGMDAFNPSTIINGFTAGSMPSCSAITMETVDVNNTVGSETRHVADVDIRSIDPCLFKNKKNPISNDGCIETFITTTNTFPKNDNNNILIIILLIIVYLFVNYFIQIKK
jgi:hypothetical protein